MRDEDVDVDFEKTKEITSNIEKTISIDTDFEQMAIETE